MIKLTHANAHWFGTISPELLSKIAPMTIAQRCDYALQLDAQATACARAARHVRDNALDPVKLTSAEELYCKEEGIKPSDFAARKRWQPLPR